MLRSLIRSRTACRAALGGRQGEVDEAAQLRVLVDRQRLRHQPERILGPLHGCGVPAVAPGRQ
jgi:hypothetical protein